MPLDSNIAIRIKRTMASLKVTTEFRATQLLESSFNMLYAFTNLALYRTGARSMNTVISIGGMTDYE
jgi:hypothetical protein